MSKVILVTGGTSGIGRALVEDALKAGHKVATFSRSSVKVEDLHKELSEAYPEEQFQVEGGDVSDEESVRHIIGDVYEKFGRIDVLVNNAGFDYRKNGGEMDKVAFQQMMDTNLMGVVYMTEYVTPYMKDQGGGQVINVSSIAGKHGFANSEFYNASKFAVQGFSEGIRYELNRHKIKVATVCPGMVKTNFYSEEEMKRRKELNDGNQPSMLEPIDVVHAINTVIGQSLKSDIQDLTVMPTPW